MNLVDLAGFAAFNRTRVTERNPRTSDWLKSAKKASQCRHGCFEQTRTHGIDALATWEFDRGCAHKPLDAAIGQTRCGTIGHRLMVEHPTGQGDRAAITQIGLPDQGKLDLPHQFVCEAECPLLRGQFQQRCPAHLPRCSDDGVELAETRERLLNAVWISQIQTHVSRLTPGQDQFMARPQLGGHCATDRSLTTYQQNFHALTLVFDPIGRG